MKTYYIVFYSFMLFGLSVNIGCGTQKDERLILGSESSVPPAYTQIGSMVLRVEESTWFFPDVQMFFISKQKLSNAILKYTKGFQGVYDIHNVRESGGEADVGISFSVHLKDSVLVHEINRIFTGIKCRVTFDYGGRSVVNMRTVLSFEDCSSKDVFFQNKRLLIPYGEISSA